MYFGVPHPISEIFRDVPSVHPISMVVTYLLKIWHIKNDVQDDILSDTQPSISALEYCNLNLKFGMGVQDMDKFNL